MPVDNSKAPVFELFIGATGCGKSTELQKRLRLHKPARLMVWDQKGEYSNIPRVQSMGELYRAATTKNGQVKKAFKVRFVPGRLEPKAKWQAFSTFCGIAMYCGDVMVLGEELQFVTRPNGGPPGYLELLSTGRGYGVRFMGTTQRPARVDKDLFGNATRIWCGRLGWDDDADVMRRALRVPADWVQGLSGYQSIARDLITDTTYRNGKKIVK